jgi:hypothetical protein
MFYLFFLWSLAQDKITFQETHAFLSFRHQRLQKRRHLAVQCCSISETVSCGKFLSVDKNDYVALMEMILTEET